MDRVLIILNKLFNSFFVSFPGGARSVSGFILRMFRSTQVQPLILWGAIFLIIGFVVGIVSRIIHS